jgi:hypothetical protein
MNIFITKHGLSTLMDVIIVDLRFINIVRRTSMVITHATMMVVQKKKQSYVKQTLVKRTSGNDFILLAIEMFGCFHFHFDSFFTTCVQTTIARRQRSFLIPLMLVSYYQQHMSIALQCVQAITIFQRATIFG